MIRFMQNFLAMFFMMSFFIVTITAFVALLINHHPIWAFVVVATAESLLYAWVDHDDP